MAKVSASVWLDVLLESWSFGAVQKPDRQGGGISGVAPSLTVGFLPNRRNHKYSSATRIRMPHPAAQPRRITLRCSMPCPRFQQLYARINCFHIWQRDSQLFSEFDHCARDGLQFSRLAGFDVLQH